MPPYAHLLDGILQNLTVSEQVANRLDPQRMPDIRRQMAAAVDLRPLLDQSGGGPLGRSASPKEPPGGESGKPSTSTSPEAETSEAGKEEYIRGQLIKAGELILKGRGLFDEGASGSGPGNGQTGLFKVFRSYRFFCRAKETIYPLVHEVEPVNLFFREKVWPEGQQLLERSNTNLVSQAGPDDTGIFNAQNERGKRGGFHLYVPEDYTGEHTRPLIVALHGGSGHGADFFWSWLSEARSRGAILLAPSSRGRTWSLGKPSEDIASLRTMINFVFEKYSVDRRHILLTGLSDGGTYSLVVAAVLSQSPFTHYAPMACAAHALEGALEKLKGKRIYLVHGSRDWMFPIETIRKTADALTSAGADLVFREVPDLSHNYPRDENTQVLDWFLADKS